MHVLWTIELAQARACQAVLLGAGRTSSSPVAVAAQGSKQVSPVIISIPISAPVISSSWGQSLSLTQDWSRLHLTKDVSEKVQPLSDAVGAHVNTNMLGAGDRPVASSRASSAA